MSCSVIYVVHWNDEPKEEIEITDNLSWTFDYKVKSLQSDSDLRLQTNKASVIPVFLHHDNKSPRLFFLEKSEDGVEVIYTKNELWDKDLRSYVQYQKRLWQLVDRTLATRSELDLPKRRKRNGAYFVVVHDGSTLLIDEFIG